MINVIFLLQKNVGTSKVNLKLEADERKARYIP